MLEESRPAAGCANVISDQSCDYFLDSSELIKCKNCTSSSLLRRSEQVDSASGALTWKEMKDSVPPNEEDEASEVCGAIVYEGEEDLDALMRYIDGDDGDEVDYHRSAHISLAAADKPPSDPTSKRKRSSDEEVESELCKRQRFHCEAATFVEVISPEVYIDGTGSGVTQPEGDDIKSGDEFCLEHCPDEIQMLCDDFGFEMPEQECSSCSPDGGGDSVSSGSARQSRRQKIKETVKLLREAIPGGECMDAALVLEEAINYVKLLQLQVQALGVQRLSQRAGR